MELRKARVPVVSVFNMVQGSGFFSAYTLQKHKLIFSTDFNSARRNRNAMPESPMGRKCKPWAILTEQQAVDICRLGFESSQQEVIWAPSKHENATSGARAADERSVPVSVAPVLFPSHFRVASESLPSRML